VTGEELPPFELGYPRTELRRQLVAAVLRGEKTATAGLAEDFESEGEPMPRAGDRYLLHGFDDEPVAVVEITHAEVVPARDIDLQFARDEGEGFESVENWRLAHEAFFERPIDDTSLIVAQRFRLVDS
jgi:uncharacterized protein YhfF